MLPSRSSALILQSSAGPEGKIKSSYIARATCDNLILRFAFVGRAEAGTSTHQRWEVVAPHLPTREFQDPYLLFNFVVVHEIVQAQQLHKWMIHRDQNVSVSLAYPLLSLFSPRGRHVSSPQKPTMSGLTGFGYCDACSSEFTTADLR